jgi:putative acetyltransferase
MIIRLEQPGDIDGIRDINEKAFGQSREANIVDNLRKNCEDVVSLVALEKKKIAGHVLFSPVIIEGRHGTVKGMGLAPMAVLPEFQRQGIGSQLVNAGIEHLRKIKCPFILVLGHPDYYPRFGFEQASRFGIKSQWEGIPDNVFMILWLDASMINRISGIAKYRREFVGRGQA